MIEIIEYPSGEILEVTEKQLDTLVANGLVSHDDDWTEEKPNGQYGFNEDDREEIEELISRKVKRIYYNVWLELERVVVYEDGDEEYIEEKEACQKIAKRKDGDDAIQLIDDIIGTSPFPFSDLDEDNK